MFRLSKESDKTEISRLLTSSFGLFPLEMGALNKLNGRYLLYTDSDDYCILGMSGLIWSNELNAYKIDWSCVKSSCRHQGIMHDLFKRICGLTDEKIYCSCWRLYSNRDISMKSLMYDFGFTEVLPKYKAKYLGHNCLTACAERYRDHLKSCCKCWEDLYVRIKR